MCMACDPMANGVLNLEEGSVFVGDKTVERVNRDCRVLLWNMSKVVIPYSKRVADLSRCDMKNAEESRVIEKFDWSGIILGMDDDANNAKIDENNITEVMSFGSRVNRNIEGNISYLLKLEDAVSKFLFKPQQ